VGEYRKQKRCPNIDRVQPYLDDLLPSQAATAFEAHLPGCPDCQKAIETYRGLDDVLEDAAQVPLPECDLDRVLEHLLDIPKPTAQRRPWWPVPAFATVAAAALALFFLLWLPGHDKKPFEPKEAPKAIVPTQIAKPVLVTYLAGQVSGPRAKKNKWILAPRVETEVGKDAALAFRLGERISVAAFGDSRLTVERKQDKAWLVDLKKGALAARLHPNRQEPFRVKVPFGFVEATGTAFSVTIAKDEALIQLSEGSLKLSCQDGAVEYIKAPSVVGLSRGAVRQATIKDIADETLLARAARMDPFEKGELGWIFMTSQPEVAQIWQGGDHLGNTPLLFARPGGRLQAMAKATDRIEELIRIEIEPGRLIKRHFELELIPKEQPALPDKDPLARFRKLLAARKTKKAIAGLTSYLGRKPKEQHKANLLLADAYRLADRPQKALGIYRQVAAGTRDARLAEAALFEIGVLQLEVIKVPQEALKTFLYLRRNYPKGLLRQEVAYNLAESYMATKDFHRARRALEDYLRLFPHGTKVKQAKTVLKILEEKGWK
jgi:ferric-dicitrate binding protein FerR (iron transport regulator)